MWTRDDITWLYLRSGLTSGVSNGPDRPWSGTATWLGGTGTVLLGGFLWLRKFLSKDAADRAMDNADIGTVRRLNELLDSEREARKLAEARADQFAKERNDLAISVGSWRATSSTSPRRLSS